jgi:GNAT superfamily N-acetyltransferase
MFKHGSHDQSRHNPHKGGGGAGMAGISNVKVGEYETYDDTDESKVQIIEARYQTEEGKNYILRQENLKYNDGRNEIEVRAYEPKENKGLKPVGSLQTSYRDEHTSAIIDGVVVDEEYQRQGIATAMLGMVRTYNPGNKTIEHSYSLTEDAQAWARVTKHGTHDQSSHNPHKGGRGSGGGGVATRTFEAGQDEQIHAALKDEQGAYINTLSEEQLKSVAGYQAEGTYEDVNGFLRGEKGPIAPADEAIIGTLDGVIEGAGFQYNTTVYRGVSDTDGQFRDLKVGDVIIEKGFSSTSPNPAVAEAFANSSVIQGQPVVLEIDVPFGQPALASDVASMKLFGYDIIQDDPMIVEITGFTRLNEVTLPRGLNMEVIKVTDKENARYVKVKINK